MEKKEAENRGNGVDMSQIINRPNSLMLGLLSIKLRDGTQHDDLAYRNISRKTLIKGKHVVHDPRRQLEVLNVDRGGIPGVETRIYAILSE